MWNRVVPGDDMTHDPLAPAISANWVGGPGRCIPLATDTSGRSVLREVTMLPWVGKAMKHHLAAAVAIGVATAAGRCPGTPCGDD